MIQWDRWAWLFAWAIAMVLVTPGLALAHNCGSLTDCWNMASAAGATAAGVGGLLGGLLAGGLFGGGLFGHGAGSTTVGPEGGGHDIEFKRGVNIDNLSKEMRDTFPDIDDVWEENGAPTPVITSGDDSKHRGSNAPGTDCSTEQACRQTSDSLHYQNQGIDLRARDVSDELQDQMAADLQDRLGDDYDVQSEHFPSNPNRDHIHVEYDPT